MEIRAVGYHPDSHPAMAVQAGEGPWDGSAMGRAKSLALPGVKRQQETKHPKNVVDF